MMSWWVCGFHLNAICIFSIGVRVRKSNYRWMQTSYVSMQKYVHRRRSEKNRFNCKFTLNGVSTHTCQTSIAFTSKWFDSFDAISMLLIDASKFARKIMIPFDSSRHLRVRAAGNWVNCFTVRMRHYERQCHIYIFGNWLVLKVLLTFHHRIHSSQNSHISILNRSHSDERTKKNRQAQVHRASEIEKKNLKIMIIIMISTKFILTLDLF